MIVPFLVGWDGEDKSARVEVKVEADLGNENIYCFMYFHFVLLIETILHSCQL